MSEVGGQTLGSYRILYQVGRGGMAAVYKAEDTRLNRPVALKVLFPQLTVDHAFVTRFRREAQIAARLEHPNIVTIYDVGEIQGVNYIAMQFLDGQTLQQIIARNGSLPLSEALSVLAQVAEALDFAHSQGVVHRDIKPTNIMVGAGGRVTLTDFGIARAREDSRLTGTGQMLGTPQYMAPEQVQGGAVDRRTDIYALGIVLFEMLTGRTPFQADTPVAVLHQQVYAPPPPVRRFSPSLSNTADRVLQKALSKDPQQRFRSAGQMVKALQGDATSAPWSSVEPITVVEPARAPATPDERMVAPVPAPARTRERSGWILAFAAVALVAIALFLVLLAVGGNSNDATPTLAAAVTDTPQVTAPLTRLPATLPPSPADTIEPTIDTPKPIPPTDTPVGPTPMPTHTPTLEPPEPDPAQMIRVPAGCFLQGSTRSEIESAASRCTANESEPNAKVYCALASFQDEVPLHEVCLDAFYIDQYEVTNAQYQACVQAGACDPPRKRSSNTRESYYGNGRYSDYPVIHVGWRDARDYCNWVGKRLPTEAEWEKAARGESGAEWPWGSSFAEDMCNTRARGVRVDSSDTEPVGSYWACTSPYGSMDMVGNVWEWVADRYGKQYYAQKVRDNPAGPSSGETRVIRGSSWNSNVGGARAPSRAGANPNKGYFDIGFRCAND